MTGDLHPFLAKLAAVGAWTPPEPPTRPRNGAAGHTPLPPAGDPQAARYADAALVREANIVAGTPEGTRNNDLNRAAFRMGQLIALGWLPEQAVFDRLVDAGMASGLPYAESERTVLSGLAAGKTVPRDDVELHPTYGPAHAVDLPVGVSGGAEREVSNDMGSDEPPRPHVVPGGVFMLDTPATVPAIWGDGDEVLWAEGEPLLITGPTGVGKTTLGTMLIAGRMGILPDALGYSVRPGRKVLLYAMDRPRQIQRAMARLLRSADRDLLDERLVVWQGPPPMDIGRHPHTLIQLAEKVGADTVVLDSLKDAAIKLSDEEVGHGLSRAMNMCVTHGIEVLGYHHQTKRGAGGIGKPNSIADVYGSSWITAGAGSVLLIWGDPGDLVVELSHLKQPADVVGPLAIGFDHQAGRAFLYDGMSEHDKLLDLLASGPQTASTVASWLTGKAADRAAVARARRRLDKLVEAGHATQLDDTARRGGAPGGSRGGADGIRYVRAQSPNASQSVQFSTHASTHGSAGSMHAHDVSAGHTTHAPDIGSTHGSTHESNLRRHTSDVSAGHSTHVSTHAPNARSTHAPPPPFKGGEGRTGRARRAGREIELEPGDLEVCARCHQPAERLIPAPGGRQWCPRCAYPTEPPPGVDPDEDQE